MRRLSAARVKLHLKLARQSPRMQACLRAGRKVRAP
jgi:hypothetical protein